jgi:sugar phosphate permease
LTVAGVAGVGAEDAGAASGMVNVAHQLGGSLGLAVLVAVFTFAGHSGTLAHQIAAAFAAGTIMLACALAIVMAFIVRPLSGAMANASPRC